MSPTTDDLREDFERVIDELGHVPSRKEYEKHGAYDIIKFLHAFSDRITYAEAVQTLGYTPPNLPGGRRTVPPERVRQDFEQVVYDLERVPTTTEYTEHGEYCAQTVGRKFSEEGSYPKAVQNLGYEPPNPHSETLTPQDIKQDIDRITDKLGWVPGRTDYQRHGEYSPQTVIRLGKGSGSSFTSAIRNLGYEPYQTV